MIGFGFILIGQLIVHTFLDSGKSILKMDLGDSEKGFLKRKVKYTGLLLIADWSTDSAHFFRFWEKYFENGLGWILKKVFPKRRGQYT